MWCTSSRSFLQMQQYTCLRVRVCKRFRVLFAIDYRPRTCTSSSCGAAWAVAATRRWRTPAHAESEGVVHVINTAPVTLSLLFMQTLRLQFPLTLAAKWPIGAGAASSCCTSSDTASGTKLRPQTPSKTPTKTPTNHKPEVFVCVRT